MIDVLHPGNTELGRRFAQPETTQRPRLDEHEGAEDHGDSEDEESAWLQSVQASMGEDVGVVKGLESGSLVMDVSQLRIDSTGVAPDKPVKGKLPA